MYKFKVTKFTNREALLKTVDECAGEVFLKATDTDAYDLHKDVCAREAMTILTPSEKGVNVEVSSREDMVHLLYSMMSARQSA